MARRQGTVLESVEEIRADPRSGSIQRAERSAGRRHGDAAGNGDVDRDGRGSRDCGVPADSETVDGGSART